MSGHNSGNVVQAGSVFGGVHFYQSTPGARPVDGRLLAALRAMTVPLRLGPAARTAFTVAPGRLATYGTAVLFRDGGTDPYPCLHGAVEPGDELWALGYPRGDESAAEVAGLRCLAVLDSDHADPHPLQLLFGSPGIGSTGGPVLNWRTGSVCGLLLVTDDGLWLVPSAMIRPAAPADGAWLALMDDDQLRASGQRYPGAALRAYLADVRQLGEGHPYRPMVQQGPSLTAFYLPQHLYHESDGANRITVEALADRHEGAQVLGDPGVGKSSLVRHLASASAIRWLDDHTGTFVPIPLSARALSASGSLPGLLADGVTREIATVMDRPALVDLFEHEPMPGVPWLVLVDGLDEVLSEFDRRMVLDRVLGQRRREHYRFMVTSRPLGRGAFDRLARDYPTYVVEPFDEDELARFARAWFIDAGHDAVDIMAAEFMAQVTRSGLGRLARVPLVSMMLCIVFTGDGEDGLPRSQYAVYERFFTVLARKLETAGVREEFRRHAMTYGAAAEEAVARLVTELPALLEGIAVSQQGLGVPLDSRPILVQAVERSRVGKPPAIPDETWASFVKEALRASGLLVQTRDEFRFLHQTIGEYLAAKSLAARASTADRRVMLAPRAEWPWPHLEIIIFVVALWTVRDIDLTPQYTKLLKGRHRETNVGFLVELGRRGIPLPDRVRARVGDILAARIHSGRTMAREWLEATHWLRDLEPARAVDELARLVRDIPGNDRAIDAVTQLISLNPRRGTDLARTVSLDSAQSPVKCLALAKKIIAIDRGAGIEVLEKLARSRRMGSFAVDAATRLADANPALGLELLGRLATSRWSIEVTLTAGRALLGREGNGLAELDRVWQTMDITAADRLALVNHIARVDAVAAERRYEDLAEAKSAPAAVRVAAAQALAGLNFERGMLAFRLLASDDRLESTTRVSAAAYLADKLSQGNEVLASLAEDESMPARQRIEAARLLARSDPGLAAGVLAKVLATDGGQWQIDDVIGGLTEGERVKLMVCFVGNSAAPTEDRLAVARRLVDRGQAVEILRGLEEIAFGSAHTKPNRLSAAGLITAADEARGRTVLLELAEDERLPARSRVAAIDQLRDIDETVALDLYLRICSHPGDIAARIEAGRAVGEIDRRVGVKALTDLARTVGMRRHIRLIAEAAVDVDRGMAAKEWQYMSRYARHEMEMVLGYRLR
jgi:hypothetical protein